MNIIGSLKAVVDYGVVSVSNVVNKIVTNPSAVKKTGQLVSVIIEGVNYRQGGDHLPDLVRNIRGTNEIIDLYSTFKNVIFWMNPFETQKIDKQKFVETLAKGLSKGNQKSKLSSEKNNALKNKKALALFNKVMEKGSSVTNPQILSQILEQTLIESKYHSTKAKEIAYKTTICLKSRTFLKILKGVCDSISGTGYNLITLEKWKLIDLNKIVKEIGTQFPKFTEIASRLSFRTFLGTVSCIGSGLGGMEAVGAFFKARRIIYDVKQTPEAIQTAYRARTHALWDIATSGIDLISTTLPMVKVLSYPTLMGLALVAKTAGLLSIIFKA